MHNRIRLRDESIDLIKYSLLVGVDVSTLSSHFVTRYTQPIFPSSISLRNINVLYTCNIKRALRSHQQRPFGRSKYEPLPESYDPYNFILPKRGSEHLILPPFTHEVWKSQFSRNISNSATMHQARMSSSSVNPANRPRPGLASSFINALSPRNRSAYQHASATIMATRNSGSVRLSDGSLNPILPRIISSGAEVSGKACAYHIEAEFNSSGVVYYGYGFNVYARYVPNAITSNGYMYDALLVGTMHSLPFDNSLPFRDLACIVDGRTILLPMVWGVELGMIDETAEHISDRDHVTGTQNEQLGASFHVVREHIAPHAVHHGMIAIDFINIPNNYCLSKSGMFQDQVTLEQQRDALTCHMKSKSFTLRDPDLPEDENTFDYNQTSFTYIVPLNDPGTKVASRSEVDTVKLMMERNFTTTSDVDELSDRFANDIHLRSMRGSHRKSSAVPTSGFTTTSVPKKAKPTSINTAFRTPGVTTAFRTPGVATAFRSPTFGSRMSSKSKKANPKVDTRSESPVGYSARYVPVKGEGNCLPLSIAYYVYGSSDDKYGDKVRKEVVKFLREHIAFYAEKFGLKVRKLEKKLNNWEQPGVWLGEEFIHAAATLYDTQFTVFGHSEDKRHIPSYYNSQRDGTRRGESVPLLNCIDFRRSHYMPVIFHLDSPSNEGTTSPSHQSTADSAETETETPDSNQQSFTFNRSEPTNASDDESGEEVRVESVHSSSDSEINSYYSSSSNKAPSSKAPSSKTLSSKTSSSKTPPTKAKSPSPMKENEGSYFGMGFMNVLRRTPQAKSSSVPSTASPSAARSNVPGLVSVSSPPLVQVLEDSTIQGATIPADNTGNSVVKKKSRHRSKSIVGEKMLVSPENPKTRVSSRTNKGVKPKTFD